MTTINGVPRELLERLALPPASSSGWTEWNTAVAYEAARELRTLLTELPQAGAGQDVPDVVRQFVESQAVCSDCHLDEACCRPLLRAAKEAFAAAPQPAARHDQGDEVHRLREALAGLVALYEDDEGCRSLPQYKAARAALTHPQQGAKE